MFKPLRKERIKGDNSEKLTNVEEKVIRLNGIDFHKQDVAEKLQLHYTPDTLPEMSEAYMLRKKDLRRPKKKEKKDPSEENPVTYNDLSNYYCNFDNEVKKGHSTELKQKVK